MIKQCGPYISKTILAFLFILLSTFNVTAQDRGLAVVANSIAGTDLKIGRQYAVLIAIDKYEEWSPLRNPVSDARTIKEILQRRYFIDEFIELYNENATSSGIRRLFSSLIEKIGPTDSVLIYYAGHGYLDMFKTGFWIPVDGGKDIDAQKFWIPNAQIRNFVTQIKARSVALVSDSCFSGDLLIASRGATPTIDSAYYRNALRYTARQVLTSGASETVPDESEFARQFKTILENNTETCLDPLAMYDRIRRGVTDSLPLFGTLPGHEQGGSFVLFLRESAVNKALASLYIDGLPQMASVRLSSPTFNKNLDWSDGSRLESVPIGSYSLTITHPLWKTSYSDTIQISQEGDQRRTVPTGWIEMPSLPSGAVVLIDNKPCPIDIDSGLVKTPPLLNGTYNLKISAPYVRQVSMSVEVPAGKSVPVTPKLIPFGIMNIEVPSPSMVVEVSTVAGSVIKPANGFSYELDEGEYVIKARPSDDISWSWKGDVSVNNGLTVSFTIPKEATDYSITWKIQQEEKSLSSLKAKYENAIVRKNRNGKIGTASLITGGVSTVAAGVMYFLGASAMATYRNATTLSEVQDSRADIELFNTLLLTSASLSGIGFGVGGFFLATIPKPEQVEQQVQDSIERIRKLETQKLIKGVE